VSVRDSFCSIDPTRRLLVRPRSDAELVIVLGAGDAGSQFIRQIFSDPDSR
jgi:hypothetical protein